MSVIYVYMYNNIKKRFHNSITPPYSMKKKENLFIYIMSRHAPKNIKQKRKVEKEN